MGHPHAGAPIPKFTQWIWFSTLKPKVTGNGMQDPLNMIVTWAALFVVTTAPLQAFANDIASTLETMHDGPHIVEVSPVGRMQTTTGMMNMPYR